MKSATGADIPYDLCHRCNSIVLLRDEVVTPVNGKARRLHEKCVRDGERAIPIKAWLSLACMSADERAVLIGFRRQMDYGDPNDGMGPLWTCDEPARITGGSMSGDLAVAHR